MKRQRKIEKARETLESLQEISGAMPEAMPEDDEDFHHLARLVADAGEEAERVLAHLCDAPPDEEARVYDPDDLII